MNGTNSYEVGGNTNNPTGQTPGFDVGNNVRQELPTNKGSSGAKAIIAAVKKILKYILIVAIYCTAIVSIPLALSAIEYGLQEQKYAQTFSIIAAATICAAVIMVSLIIKRHQQLSQIVDQKLSMRLMIHGVICSISSAAALLVLVSVIMMDIEISTSCEAGSSCNAAFIVPSLTSASIIPFAALSILSIIRIVKINKIIATQLLDQS